MAKFVDHVVLTRFWSGDQAALPSSLPVVRYWIKDDADPEYELRGLLQNVSVATTDTVQTWWDGIISQIETEEGIGA